MEKDELKFLRLFLDFLNLRVNEFRLLNEFYDEIVLNTILDSFKIDYLTSE
jgi:hypothetical protein